jgi:hypothetical protein
MDEIVPILGLEQGTHPVVDRHYLVLTGYWKRKKTCCFLLYM